MAARPARALRSCLAPADLAGAQRALGRQPHRDWHSREQRLVQDDEDLARVSNDHGLLALG